MDPVTILTLVTFAVTSSASLYKTVDGLKSRKQEVRRLKAEVGHLNIVLQALAKNIEETTEEFEVLRLILEQCAQTCTDFEKEVLDHVKKSGRRFDDVKAWARLQFMGGDISSFEKLLGNYKATLTIALADSNLRTANVTKQLLEKYTEMTQDTTSDLEDQISELSHKLEVFRGEHATALSSTSSRRGPQEPITTKKTRDQRASLEQCLVVCRQLLDHVEAARRSIPQDAASVAGTVNGDCATRETDDFAPRLTDDALQMCSHNINAAARHLQDLQQMKKMPVGPDASRIMQQLDSARQCLGVVAQAQQHRVNVFEDIDIGDDSFQTVVSTIGDLIRARGLKIGGRSINIMGQMHDESLQKMTDILRTDHVERVAKQDGDVTFEKRHGFGYTIPSREL